MSSTIKYHLNCTFSKSSNDLVSAQMIYSISILLSFGILEYACVVWHHNLTAQQSDKIESLQKRALRIINGDQVFGMPYDSLLFLSNIERLHQRRADAGMTFFDGVCQETSCLYHLLPDKRDPHIISKSCDLSNDVI